MPDPIAPAAVEPVLGGAPAGAAPAAAPSQGAAPAGGGPSKVAAPSGDEAAAKAAADKAAAEAGVKPVEYADFTLPEGVKFNDEILGEFKTTAAELKLDQAGAQKMVDLGQKMVTKAAAAQFEALQAQVKTWETEARADKEFGGVKFDENVALANRALATYGSPALTELLRGTGLSQHPEIIRAFYKMGQATAEDKFVPSTKPASQSSPLGAMYPRSNHT